MNWAILVIASLFLYSLVEILDKHVFEVYHKNVAIRTIFYGGMGGVFALLFLLFRSISFGPQAPLLLYLGFAHVLMIIFWFKAISIDEVSRMITIYHTSALFVVLLGYIFLGEMFSALTYLGIALLIIGSMLVSVRRLGGLVKISKGVLPVLIAAAGFACITVLTKHAIDLSDPWSAYFWINLGAGLTVLPLIAYYRKPLRKLMKTSPRSGIIMAGAESIGLVGFMLTMFAFSIGPASLIASLSQVQPAIVLGYVVLLSVFRPSVLKEELGKNTLILKAVAIALMIVGAVLIL
ncbi:MAG: EamA family transporter [archaeon]